MNRNLLTVGVVLCLLLAGCSGGSGTSTAEGPDTSSEVAASATQTSEATATTQDSDGDGLSDSREAELGTDPDVKDTDGDGLSDGAEVEQYDTDPTEVDTDGDGLEDGTEVNEYGTDPTEADTDGDGLDDIAELEEYETDPTKADTDGDGLDDGPEVNEYETNPSDHDSDGDGLDDGTEVNRYGTDPTVADSDDDGLGDGTEVEEYDTVPTEVDSDGDGLEDGAEVEEYDTDPAEADTDDDGLDDGEELKEYETDPTEVDTDGDGLEDGAEVNNEALAGADPTRKDVFVEVDYMSGNDVRTSDFEEVVERFDEAPVSNPDGERGIDLHVVVDEEVPGESETTAATVGQQVNEHADYRDDGYHYALVVNDARVGGEDTAGFASIGRLVIEDSGDAAELQSLFMHELGHSLGLGSGVAVSLYEGIDSTEVSFDDYPSVMNYNAPGDTIQYSDGTNSDEDHDDWKTVATRMSCAPQGDDNCRESA